MSDLTCPKCTDPMSTWRPADFDIDHCPNCNGLWFDASELTRHLATIGGPRLTEQPEAGAQTNLVCPRCPHQKLQGSFLLDVAIEACSHCGGIFLDLGEVHELLGALDPAARDAVPKSGGSKFDNFALGLFVGMRQGSDR